MPPVVEFDSVVKNYHGLRPLRVAHLEVAEGETVAVSGLDAAAAEILTSLVTGAAVPDSGTVRVFGQDTREIADVDTWLAGLDRIGLLTDRVVLLDGLTVAQNIAIPLTLELDALPPDIDTTIRRLAAEVGLGDAALRLPPGEASASDRFRARLARGLATMPRLLVAEHPTLGLPRPDVQAIASEVARLARSRGLSVLLSTDDDGFARVVTAHRLMLNPATGTLTRWGRRAWFS